MQEIFSIENLRRIDAKFKLKERGSFLLCGGSIKGIEFPRLYHVQPISYDVSVINNMKYFENKVNVNSCEEALNFARLLTSFATRNCFEDTIGLEILIMGEVDMSANFGINEWFDSFDTFESGYCAVISKNDAAKISAYSARCKNINNTFLIERFIFQMDKNGIIEMSTGDRANLVLIKEEVSRSGKYRLISKKKYRSNVQSIDWSYRWTY